jgi:hypothetical protein
MIFTLAWKELREHQGIWITMVFMSIALGLGLAKIIALSDPNLAMPVATLTILGLAATYGVVCGAMMFAGEHEGGTLVFLDIFLGRRGLLWLGKFAIGLVLVVTQAVAVALVLVWLKQEAPAWVSAIVGGHVGMGPRPLGAMADAKVWLLILPVVTLEAFGWGLLGSSFTQRVLAGAALAALGFTPVLLLTLCAPVEVFIFIRLIVMALCLGISFATFLGQSREASRGAPLLLGEAVDANAKAQFLQRWERFERYGDVPDDQPVHATPASVPAASATWTDERREEDAPVMANEPDDEPEPPQSPQAALWWLTLRQAWPLVGFMAAASLFAGCNIPANAEVLWPVATLLLGVGCGTAAFAAEQRDLSYQFLAAQHLPLRMIWCYKIAFWLIVAVLQTLMMVIAAVAMIALRGDGPLAARFNLPSTFHDLIGPTLFFGGWLFYGFCAGQLIVWYCRKTILALLVGTLVSGVGIGLWLPSLLCGGMSGWQVWPAPIAMLAAGWCLLRAWAGGRLWERKPLRGFIAFLAALIVWALANFTYRACEIPDVAAPVDAVAFRATLPNENLAGNTIQQAILQVDEPGEPWLKLVAAAAHQPVGMLEWPSSEGFAPGLRHLPGCEKIGDRLLRRAGNSAPEPAFEHIAEVLALSRNLRNKAPVESYLFGIQQEGAALDALDQWFARGKPTPKLLRHVLDELNRHAAETPPPLDCLQTECFRSKGALANTNFWTFAPAGARRIPERWLVGAISVSLETPWEDVRKERLWRLVWAGLFRGLETPHWELPEAGQPLQAKKDATRVILQGWLPPTPGVDRAHVAKLLDDSWLADERLFCSITNLRSDANRSRWRVDATRQAVALALYHLEHGKPAAQLEDLVPKYLPVGLPTDPYSGENYRCRFDPINGQATVWSTGPDRIDHGGRKHGGHLADGDPGWIRGGFDLIITAPHWP